MGMITRLLGLLLAPLMLFRVLPLIAIGAAVYYFWPDIKPHLPF